MITNNDCIILLTEIANNTNDGEAIKLINTLASTTQISLNALKYINKHRSIEVINFYEYLRKNYNKKHSTVYINIVKEVEEPKEVLTTLSALLTQILLYGRDIDNKPLFYKHARASEISKVLTHYFNTYDITKAIELIKLIKADLLALESVNGRRILD